MHFIKIRGIHPPQLKLTAKIHTSKAEIPDKLIVPLQQHIGCTASPIVKAGDYVKKYQKIGAISGNVCANIHAPTSGRVVEVAPKQHPLGKDILSVVIEPDKRDDCISLKTKDPKGLSRDELIRIVKEAGIVGLGGAMFPTHLKLSSNKPIDTVILNGAECEPCITSDHRVMVEHPEKVVRGLKILMRCVGAKKAYIAIEDNKRDAAETMAREVKDERNIDVVILKTSYPQGAEKIIVANVVGRVVPSGLFPVDVGVLVNNVSTAKAVYDAVYEGKPLVERIVTITGDVVDPKNLVVKIGTPIVELVKQCGGYLKTPKKIIMGGPMMGIALPTDNVPVVKGTTSVVVQSNPEKNEKEACIRCGKCIEVCPMNLSPRTIAFYSEKGMFDKAANYYPMDCFECGACAYVCPAKIPLVSLIRKAKSALKKK